MDNLSSQVNLWIQRLCAIAQTGLAFGPGVYDRERYEELLKLAADIAATNAALAQDARLSNALYDFWQSQIRPGVPGYVTPKVGIGALVFNDRDEILLVKRPTGQWLYPTGWADVGYSPAQVAEKEVLEETGLRVTPLRLVAVNDVRATGDDSDVSLHFYSLVFYCRLDGGTLNRHLTETLDAGFYPLGNLPRPLAREDLHWVELATAARHGAQEAYFDRP